MKVDGQTAYKRLCPKCGATFECFKTNPHRICAGCEIALANDPQTAYADGKTCRPWRRWATKQRGGSIQ